jgi:RNA polymerase sigma factor (sigma-70 family)
LKDQQGKPFIPSAGGADIEHMQAAGSHAPVTVDHAYPRSRHLLRLASDERLVARVRAGSEQAFTVLYERHHRKVLSFCRHMLGSREEAEDAVQQSFVNAYRDMLRNDKPIEFRPWLYRIARNQCISILRARRANVDLEDAEPSTAGLSRQVAERDDLRDLLRDLSRLPDDQREALVLAELHGNSHSDVAEILGCERQKVKSLVFQARNSLIKSREARETPCDEIRAQLSVLRGGSLRRNVIRRHLAQCEGCRAWRAAAQSQRRAMAVLLPVIPSPVLKLGAANAIAAAGTAAAVSHGAAGGAAAGGAAGSLTTLPGKLGLPAAMVKGAATAATVAAVAAGGTVAVKEVDDRVGGNDTPAVEVAPGARGMVRRAGTTAPGKRAGRKHRPGRRAGAPPKHRIGPGRRHGRVPLSGPATGAGPKQGPSKQAGDHLARKRPGADRIEPRKGTREPTAGLPPRESRPRPPKAPSEQPTAPGTRPRPGTGEARPDALGPTG